MGDMFAVETKYNSDSVLIAFVHNRRDGYHLHTTKHNSASHKRLCNAVRYLNYNKETHFYPDTTGWRVSFK
jgi:hypothetical protein